MARVLVLSCPSCGSERLYKAGLRCLSNGAEIQRYLCRECGYRFSGQGLNRKSGKGSCGQIGATPNAHGLVENLAITEPLKDGLAGATKDIKGKILESAWNLKKQGYAESTIARYIIQLNNLLKQCNLLDPESVKETLALHDDWSPGYKLTMVSTYNKFAEREGLHWTPPAYKTIRELPFIPLEKEIDALIAGCSRKVGAILQLLKETGMRIGEAWQLRWIDIDQERKTVKCKPEKHSNPRMFKVSEKLLDMLHSQPKDSEFTFGETKLQGFRANYIRQRKRMAKKLRNPRLNRIRFHTLRHWKATMEYHKTKDILHVKQLLGHKSIESTMLYTQLIKYDNEEGFICRTAKNVKEAKDLIESGFEFVTDMENVKLFRKRK